MASQEMVLVAEQLRQARRATAGEFDLSQRRLQVAQMADAQLLDPEFRVEPGRVGGVVGEWITASNSTKKDRVLIYCHGGGHVVGTPALCRGIAGRLADGSDLRAFAPNYRLAPECPFPADIEDVVSVYQGLLDAGRSASSIVIGGESSGGGLALSTLLSIRDQGLPIPAGGFAVSPSTDLTLSSPSMTSEQSNDPYLTREEAKVMVDYYLGSADPNSPLASPLFADLSGLPPLHFEVGTADRLLGDTVRFVAKAKAMGVEVTSTTTTGGVHVFPSNVPQAPESKAAINRICLHLRQALQKSAIEAHPSRSEIPKRETRGD